MKKHFKCLIITILVFFTNITFGQIDKSKIERKHLVYAEFIGRTFVFGSLNYEFMLRENISIGSGIGLINFQKGIIRRNVNGVTESGQYTDISSSQMIFGNYFVGKKNHKMLLTLGLTNFLFTYQRNYNNKKNISAEAQLEWNAGLGYQLSTEIVFCRLAAYLISMPDPTGWFPKYMPWLGLSIGVKIQ